MTQSTSQASADQKNNRSPYGNRGGRGGKQECMSLPLGQREMWEEELGALAFQQRAPGGAQALLQPQSSSGRGLVEWTLSGVLNSEAHTAGILWDDYWTCLSLVSHGRKETITTSQPCYKDYREYCMCWGWHIIWHIEGTWEMVVDTLNFHYYFEYWPVSWLWYGNVTLLFTQMIIGYCM